MKSDRDVASLLPPASAAREWLLQRLSQAMPEAVGDPGAQFGESLIPAAVLVPLVLRDPEPTVLLTRRTDHLHDHAGQISFPGGRTEPDDATPIHTALRETEEEIGLSRGRIEVIGRLPVYVTGTGFRVTPVVGLVTPSFTLQLDSFEVAEVFEVPLAFFLDPANHREHQYLHKGVSRSSLAMPYGDYFIWGATAGMLLSLCRLLAA